jgi:hypothetical protein
VNGFPREPAVAEEQANASGVSVEGTPLADPESPFLVAVQPKQWSPTLPCAVCDALKSFGEWWRPQIRSKDISEVCLDQVASIVVQLLFWGSTGIVVRIIIGGELTPETEIPDFVGDFLKEIYQVKVLSRDVFMAFVAAIVFALISWLPVVRRLQEDICRVLYVFGALTTVLGIFFYRANVSLPSIGYNPAYIGMEAFFIGVCVAAGTEAVMKFRAKFHFWRMVFRGSSAIRDRINKKVRESATRIGRRFLWLRNVGLKTASYSLRLAQYGRSSAAGLHFINITKGAKNLWQQGKQCMQQSPAKE